ncbi:MAG TPA: transcription antitermination factor NusB [Terrimicrobiaceae bacterium]
MGVRREGREAAVQYLYLRDLNGDSDLPAYYKFRGLSPSARRFCDELVQGAIEHQPSIDEVIRTNTQNYELARISVVDRNVLRVAIYEMLHCAEIPPVVSINEAIEIAKKYSTEESGRFVNGVLDQVMGALKRPARTARHAADEEGDKAC